jgi:DNA-binding transcriptional regulator of glucitol operon
MESAVAAEPPVWRFLVAPRWVAWHLLMVAGCVGMLWLGDWQLHRALSGNGLSWAYTFEWPLFSGFAVVFWARTIRDEFRIRRGEMPREVAAAADPVLPVGVMAAQPRPPAADADEDDPELIAYNAYLQRLNDEVKDHGKWRGWR